MLIIGHRANVMRVIQQYTRCKVKGYEIDVKYDEKHGFTALHGPSPVKRPSIPGRILGWIDYKFFYRDPLLKPMKLENIISYIESRIDKPTYMLDLRSANGLHELTAIIEKFNLWKRIIISSEIHPVIKEIKETIGDDIKCLISLNILPVNTVKLIEDAKADGISIKYTLLNEELAYSLHENGYTIAAWTINDKQTLEKIKKLNIDMVISDNPCKIQLYTIKQ